MNTITPEQRTAAKVAGISGLVAMAIVVYANYALLGPFIIPRDSVETAPHILAHQTQFRLALTGFLGCGAIVGVQLSAPPVLLTPLLSGPASRGPSF